MWLFTTWFGLHASCAVCVTCPARTVKNWIALQIFYFIFFLILVRNKVRDKGRVLGCSWQRAREHTIVPTVWPSYCYIAEVYACSSVYTILRYSCELFDAPGILPLGFFILWLICTTSCASGWYFLFLLLFPSCCFTSSDKDLLYPL